MNFEIPHQTSTAIIGPSGSGKSTLCHLLLRFYDIDDGNIRIDGVDIKDMTLSTLMSKISAVFQKVYLMIRLKITYCLAIQVQRRNYSCSEASMLPRLHHVIT